MIQAHSNFKAGMWMMGSVISFLVMSVAGREVTPVIDVFQVMEIRSVLGLLMLMPLVFAAGGLSAMRTARPLQHVGRNAVHYSGQFAWFCALTMIPLAELIAIEFTTPIWGAVLAAICLGETLSGRKVSAVALGLAGILIILRPTLGSIDPGHLVMLAGAMGFAISIVMVKSLTRTDSVVCIIFWMLIIQSIIGLVPAVAVWRDLPVSLWPAMLVISLAGMSSHFCMARALVHADATVVMPMDFVRLPLGGLIGWLLYQEQIDLFTAGGALLIVAGNLLNVGRPAFPGKTRAVDVRPVGEHLPSSLATRRES